MLQDKKIVLIMERMECDLYQAIHSDIDPAAPSRSPGTTGAVQPESASVHEAIVREF